MRFTDFGVCVPSAAGKPGFSAPPYADGAAKKGCRVPPKKSQNEPVQLGQIKYLIILDEDVSIPNDMNTILRKVFFKMSSKRPATSIKMPPKKKYAALPVSDQVDNGIVNRSLTSQPRHR